MYIVPSELEKYCKKIGTEIHIEIDIEHQDVVFRFIKGKYEMHGNTAVFLEGKEILALLEINEILGKTGSVQKIIKSDNRNKDSTIHDLIYITIAKYVIQMLNASIGIDFYPEIKSLQQHSEDYFDRK